MVQKRAGRNEIWLMRHGDQEHLNDGTIWEPTARLTPEGRTVVARVRDKHLAGVWFDLFGHSPLARAHETVEIVAPADTTLIELPALGPVSPVEWEFFHGIKTLEEAFQTAPDFLKQEGSRVWEAVLQTLSFLGDGENAFLVSHQPLIECAVAHGTNVWPMRFNLKKGEIIRLIFMNNKLAAFDHIPLPE